MSPTRRRPLPPLSVHAGRSSARGLTAKHEQALAEDEEERKAALLDPERKARAPKAEKVAVELEQARSDLELLGGMLDESSRGLLAATLPFVRAAHVEVSDRRVEAFVD